MLSIVIPVLNEAASLAELHGQLDRVADAEHYDLEIIFVDDGSTDDTWQTICRLAAGDPRVQGIRLRRTFGKAAALCAGFHAAAGDPIVTLDGDLQDDPAEIPQLVGKLAAGYDVVNGWKRVRHDPWHKVWLSRTFNWLVSGATGLRLHDHNCGLKCFRRAVMKEVRLYGELHRFVPALAAAKGFRVAEVVVNHRPRKHGQSKYGVSRVVKALLDLITVKFVIGYSHRPQHVLGSVGLVSLLLGTLGLVYLAVRWSLSRMVDGWEVVHLHQTAALYYSLGLLVVGAQFLSLGMLGEMITAHMVRGSDTYSIAEQTSPRDAQGGIASVDVSEVP